MSVYLLVETSQGATIGVRFPDGTTARDWEDRHGSDLRVVGLITTATRAEALRLCKR